jgi:hypothetical protein
MLDQFTLTLPCVPGIQGHMLVGNLHAQTPWNTLTAKSKAARQPQTSTVVPTVDVE